MKKIGPVPMVFRIGDPFPAVMEKSYGLEEWSVEASCVTGFQEEGRVWKPRSVRSF